MNRFLILRRISFTLILLFIPLLLLFLPASSYSSIYYADTTAVAPPTIISPPTISSTVPPEYYHSIVINGDDEYTNDPDITVEMECNIVSGDGVPCTDIELLIIDNGLNEDERAVDVVTIVVSFLKTEKITARETGANTGIFFADFSTDGIGQDTKMTITAEFSYSNLDGVKSIAGTFIHNGPSETKDDSIILDTTDPKGSVIINDGAEYTNNKNVVVQVECNDPDVGKLDLRCVNATLSIADAGLNASSGTEDVITLSLTSHGQKLEATETGKNTGIFEAELDFIELKAGDGQTIVIEFSFSDDNGVKGVGARFEDAAGNTSGDNDDIVLDTVPPTISATPAGGSFDSDQEVALASDEEGTVILYSFDGEEFEEYTDPIQVSDDVEITYYGLDIAGNESERKSEVYIIIEIIIGDPPSGSVKIDDVDPTIDTNLTARIICDDSRDSDDYACNVIRLLIIDPGLNIDEESIDLIEVDILSPARNSFIARETGYNTGIFEASFPLSDVGAEDGDTIVATYPFSKIDGVKTIEVEFEDEGGNSSDEQDSVEIVFPNEPPKGSITINNGVENTSDSNVMAEIVCDDPDDDCFNVVLSIPDPGLNKSFLDAESIEITISFGNESTVVTATETGPNTGVFVAGFALQDVGAKDGYVITAEFSFSDAEGVKTIGAEFQDTQGNTSTYQDVINLQNKGITLDYVSNTQPKWGIEKVVVSGTVSSSVPSGSTVTVDWGDGSTPTTGILITENSWGPVDHIYNAGVISSDPSVEIIAILIDDESEVAKSNPVSVTVKKHATALSLKDDIHVSGDTKSLVMSGALVDLDVDLGIEHKTIHFLGSSIIEIEPLVTDVNGSFLSEHTVLPDIIPSMQLIQGRFDGDELYEPSLSPSIEIGPTERPPPPTKITIAVDKTTYLNNETIIVSGDVFGKADEEPVRIDVLGPDNAVYESFLVPISSQNAYSYEFQLPDRKNEFDETWRIIARYGDASDKITFTLSASPPPEAPPSPSPDVGTVVSVVVPSVAGAVAAFHFVVPKPLPKPPISQYGNPAATIRVRVELRKE